VDAKNIRDYVFHVEFEEAIQQQPLQHRNINMFGYHSDGKWKLRTDEEAVTSLYIIKHIGLPIIEAIYKYIEIVYGVGFRNVKNSNNVPTQPEYFNSLKYQLPKFQYGKAKYEGLPSGSCLVDWLGHNCTNFNTLTTVESKVKCLNRLTAATHYIHDWLCTAEVQFEAKRAELHEAISSSDDYDKTLSKKTMTALEEEAESCGVEVSELPRYTVDSITRVVRKEFPRRSYTNVTLAVMTALTPYVEASCDGLIAAANRFAA